jgi:rod shape-determining protein MreD
MRSVWLRLDLWARNITPVGLTFVLILITMLPTHLPGFARVTPVLALISVYHWAVYRPRLLPAWALFLLGLLQDFLSGAPIGINVLIFLSVQWLVLSQRQFLVGKTFLIYWFGFALVSMVAACETWVLASIHYVSLLSPLGIFAQYLVTAGIFPLIALMFLRWQRVFLDHG